MRVAAVLVAYLVYRVVETKSFGAGLFAGFGSLILLWAAVDRLTLWPDEREGLMEVGLVILGIGLSAVGAYLYLR
ncbi:MAG TPA: hypothetical protein VNC78_06395 [Actinomycetota bacterium]|nr:hypothetical protein [Actinomycetota bacterium]